jgi:predicted  nucleic acid-binding Zn-ribbon protein
MSEESTRENPDTLSFEERVFARFDALGARLTALEEKVDRRLQETRPIWEAVQEQLDRLNSKFDILLAEFYEVKTDVARHEKRLIRIEGQHTQ